ncbi:hypothetical protein FACS1894219_09740 [Clostridia bacterium]|nr:hypothetical protein FACS1894219_09740 [Clostridia bacterium]
MNEYNSKNGKILIPADTDAELEHNLGAFELVFADYTLTATTYWTQADILTAGFQAQVDTGKSDEGFLRKERKNHSICDGNEPFEDEICIFKDHKFNAEEFVNAHIWCSTISADGYQKSYTTKTESCL